MKQLNFLLVLIFILQLSCQNTPSSKSVTIKNNFSTTVFVEVWGGESLEYNNGEVSGTTLESLLPVAEILPGAEQKVDCKTSPNIMIIVGIQNNGYKEYLKHTVITGVTDSKTYTVQADGNIL